MATLDAQNFQTVGFGLGSHLNKRSENLVVKEKNGVKVARQPSVAAIDKKYLYSTMQDKSKNF